MSFEVPSSSRCRNCNRFPCFMPQQLKQKLIREHYHFLYKTRPACNESGCVFLGTQKRHFNLLLNEMNRVIKLFMWDISIGLKTIILQRRFIFTAYTKSRDWLRSTMKLKIKEMILQLTSMNDIVAIKRRLSTALASVSSAEVSSLARRILKLLTDDLSMLTGTFHKLNWQLTCNYAIGCLWRVCSLSVVLAAFEITIQTSRALMEFQ